MTEKRASTPVEGELLRALDIMLEALQNMARGAVDQEVKTDFPLDHPVGALAAALQETSLALQASRRQREERGAELVSRIALIEQQKQVIVDLSTPVIEVWAGVLTLPLVGMFDQERATRVTTELLEAVVTLQASLVILDVTGIENVDTSVADHFLRMARTVRLLGSDCVLSGVRPAVAQTIVSMGLEVGAIRSFPTLRAALQRNTAVLTSARTKSASSKSDKSETSSRPAAATAPEPNKINDRSGFRRMK